MKEITKNMTFAELIEQNPDAIGKLEKEGMQCYSCPMAMAETIEQGALAHGVDPDKLIKELNKK